jgi:membrane associated rhomboid family serine protease
VIPLRDNIPTSRTAYVTYALIALNVISYFFWQRGGFSLGDPSGAHYTCNLVNYSAIPYEITHPGHQLAQQGCPTPTAPWYLTIFTAMFMHGGLLHLGGNMLFLWIFGNNVEDSMNPVLFLIFYLLGGVAACALQVAMGPSSQVPTLGASGAIAAVLGGYILLYPRARVVTVIFIIFFFTIIELPALVVLGIWFVEQAVLAYNGIGAQSSGGVAYFANVGGFAFGLLTIRLFASRKRMNRQRPAWSR